MEEKKFKVITTLLDGTEFISYQQYDWDNYTDKLNEPFSKFINICGVSINKKAIKTIQVLENENYREESEKKENE